MAAAGDNAVVVKTSKEIIPCKFNKVNEQGKLISMDDATIMANTSKVASTVTARYYKGIGGNRDNMVLEVSQPSPTCAAVCDFRYDEGLRLRKELVSPTISAHLGNGGGVAGCPLVIERRIVAQRGRDPDNPTDRKSRGKKLVQRYEPRSDEMCGTITSVEKDNYVVEVYGHYHKSKHEASRVVNRGGYALLSKRTTEQSTEW